jgi:hypothetical protein
MGWSLVWLLLEWSAFAFTEGFTALEALLASTLLSAFSVTETFALRLRFGFFGWRRLLVFLVDFFYALVNFCFKNVTNVVFVSESVGACGDG